MRAVTLAPGRRDSLELQQVPEPSEDEGSVLVRSLAIGICGTDRELIEGGRGESPPGSDRLILGHESLGSVIDAPSASGFAAGERVVGIVRHPDPVPCANCAAGEWDMCANGRYTERGIRQANGFAAERWRSDPRFLVKVPPSLGLAAVLLEPASVVAKAWEHIDAVGRRSIWQPRRALITGAGPVGLLAALVGKQRGMHVHVFDRNASGAKPRLVEDLGARYHTTFPDVAPDIVIECSGAAEVIHQVLGTGAPNCIVCLLGVGGARKRTALDPAQLNDFLVLGNRMVFGSVNANARHFRAAAEALERADRGWLERILTRRVPFGEWQAAYARHPGDVKTVLLLED
jgi:threonine dehydrogenase-like Zn-dependent dehydrogenase